MAKSKPPGQRLSEPPARKPSDTDSDMRAPVGMRSPSGTHLGSGPTLPAPGQLSARKTMIMGMAIMAEGPMQSDGPSVEVDRSLDRVGESETGHYKLLDKLGEGGMGAVYKALMVRKARDGTVVMERLVAIKVVKFDEALQGLEGEAREETRRSLYRRFINEVQVIAKLKHPNIIDIVDFGEEDFGSGQPDPFYVMEFLEGKDLNDMINENGPLRWEHAGRIFAQACKALEIAHNHKERVDDLEGGEKKEVPHPIVHRDVKPENVFVVPDEDDGEQRVKVLDFGIAKITAPSVKDPSHGGEMVMGTPHYMAYEQACGMTIDARTDVYGLGAMMYHVLTGCTVFDGENVTELLTKLVNEKPVPLRERRPDLDIPEEADRIVMKCLEKDPAKRYQTMGELRTDILQTFGMRTMDLSRFQSGDAWGGNSAPFPRLESENGAPNRTMQEGEMVSAVMRKQKRRKLIGGLVAGIGALAAAGIITGVVLSRAPDDAGKTPAAAVKANDAKAPMAEPIRQDAKVTVKATPLNPMKEKKRTVTFVTKLEGVQVLSADKLLCVTKPEGTCKITLKKGVALKATLKLKGYKDRKVEILKDTSGSVAVALEKKPVWRKRRRRRKPMRVKPIWK